MFTNLIYSGYNDEDEFNTFELIDSCFVRNITTPSGSPSLTRVKGNVSNTLAVFAVIKHYEMSNRNVSLNLAHYYRWLYEDGYYVDKKFIKSQLSVIDSLLKLKYCLKYYHNTITYLIEKDLIPGLE